MAKDDSGKKKDSGKKDSGKKTNPKRRGVKSQDTMANITNDAADKEAKAAKKPVSTAEQAARIKEALANKGTPKEDKPKGSSVPKRRAKGPLPSNATKQRDEARAAYNFAIDNIMQDYNLDETAEGKQIAEEIYKQQRGLDTGDIDRGEADPEADVEIPAGLLGSEERDFSDVDYNDLESGDVSTSIVDESLRRSGSGLDQSQKPELLESRRQPGVKVSRQAELALGIGARRQPDEADPSDYWSMNEKPKSVDEANQLLEAAKVRQQAILAKGQEPRSGYGTRNERAVTTAQGVESLAKANKSTDEENKLRLQIAALEHGIKNNMFGEGGTVNVEGTRVPIQQLRTGRQNFALSGTTEGETEGLTAEAAKLLTDLGSGAIMRKGESGGIPNAVSGLITMPSDDVLEKRGDILDVKTNEDTGALELANPLQRRMPVITDPETGETRDNPNYTLRSEGGVPIVAGQDGETEKTLRGYREVIARQMIGSKGGKTPESLVRIKGEGRRRGVRKRRVRGDYGGPVVTEERFGLGTEYERIQNELLADQFSKKDASDTVETMIKTEGTENVTQDLLGELSQTSDTRPETAAGDIDRAKRGSISSIPVRKNVPVLTTRDKDGNPLPKPIEDTQVGTRSDDNKVKGSDEKRLISLEDVVNMVGGTAITREEPVMTEKKDEATGLPLQAEDRDYPRDSSRRFRVRRKTYQPYDVLETNVDPTTKIKTVVRGINVNAARTGKDLMARALRVHRRMNVAGSNKPDAPEGTPPTLGQGFAKEHGLQGVEYDPAVAAEFGTPKEVKARMEREAAAAAIPRTKPLTEKQKAKLAADKEKSAKKSAERVAKLNANKPALIEAAQTADVDFILNGKRYNRAGDLIGLEDDRGINAPDRLDRSRPSITQPSIDDENPLSLGIARSSEIPGIDNEVMPFIGTRTVTPRSGPNKGVPREIPDVTDKKTKGFRDRYTEAFRKSPRSKFMEERDEFHRQLVDDNTNLKSILSGAGPTQILEELPEGWHDMTPEQQEKTGYIPGRTMRSLTPEESKRADLRPNMLARHKATGHMVTYKDAMWSLQPPDSITDQRKPDEPFRDGQGHSVPPGVLRDIWYSNDKGTPESFDKHYEMESLSSLYERNKNNPLFKAGSFRVSRPRSERPTKVPDFSGTPAYDPEAYNRRMADDIAAMSDEDLADLGHTRESVMKTINQPLPIPRHLGQQFNG